jgi:hypothetical protein
MVTKRQGDTPAAAIINPDLNTSDSRILQEADEIKKLR